MTTHESRAVDDVSSNVVNQSATTAALNAEIETLAAFKSSVENTRVKAIFESAIVILTLVRVRLLVMFLFSNPPICDTTRTR